MTVLLSKASKADTHSSQVR
uniref:Uncharacterized protein n=1 Tax=Anguilla anguilla TaxID=7936 RepID=A0A0E9TV18_ANGAN